MLACAISWHRLGQPYPVTRVISSPTTAQRIKACQPGPEWRRINRHVQLTPTRPGHHHHPQRGTSDNEQHGGSLPRCRSIASYEKGVGLELEVALKGWYALSEVPDHLQGA